MRTAVLAAMSKAYAPVPPAAYPQTDAYPNRHVQETYPHLRDRGLQATRHRNRCLQALRRDGPTSTDYQKELRKSGWMKTDRRRVLCRGGGNLGLRRLVSLYENIKSHISENVSQHTGGAGAGSGEDRRLLPAATAALVG